MTGPKNSPKNRVGQAANMTRGYLREVKTITENASRTDKDGDWGLDAWVRIIHELVDLQVRTSAAVLQAALAGPWWTEPLDVEPEPSDPVTVEAENYPRTLQAASPFVRLGLPRMAIPAHSIGFEPEVLPARGTEFRVVLKDYRFIGANYEGTVRLTPATDPKAAPLDIKVTVGL
jgi:hypothetical protein